MGAKIVPLRRAEPANLRPLRLVESGLRLQMAVAQWQDIHDEVRDGGSIRLLERTALMNEHSILIWPDAASRHERILFAGQALRAMHYEVALEVADRGVPDSPKALTYSGAPGLDGFRDGPGHRLMVLPFTRLNGTVVILFDSET